MGHVFISYSRKDKEYAHSLAHDLRQHGFDVWIDDRIDYGDSWLDVIFQAIADAAAVVVLMSPDSQKSKWVQKEYVYAEEVGKLVLPLKLNGHIFPYFVNVQASALTENGGLPNDFYKRLEGKITPKHQTGEIIVATPPSSAPQYKTTPSAAKSTPASHRTKWWVALVIAVVVVLAIIGAVLLSGGNGDDDKTGNTGTTSTESLTDTPTNEPTTTRMAQTETLTPSPTSTNTPTATMTVTAANPATTALPDPDGDGFVGGSDACPEVTGVVNGCPSTNTPTSTPSPTFTPTHTPTATPTASATLTQVATQPASTPTARTVTATPTSAPPTTAPTSSTAGLSYPCDTHIIDDPSQLLKVVRTDPNTNSPAVESVIPTEAIQVVASRRQSSRIMWYRIQRPGDAEPLGWIEPKWLVKTSTCPID